jgi:hypothetical protein
MGLPETFEAVRPSIIAFVSRVVMTKQGEVPLFPEIFGTGFFVDRSGIAATNRHVIEAIEKLNQRFPRHPTTGASATGAFVFTEIKSAGPDQVLGVLNVDVLGWNSLEQFSSSASWFGETVPDLGFVQLNIRDVPALYSRHAGERFASRNVYSDCGVSGGHLHGDIPPKNYSTYAGTEARYHQQRVSVRRSPSPWILN